MTSTANRHVDLRVAVNPVLPGFHPDPSIIRVDGEFVVATSTFQWFPGVALHRSTDLVDWEALPHPLTRRTQLDLRGVPDSGGVWAPDLSFVDGLFHLVYTTVQGYNVDGFYDTPNFHVSSPSLRGPWSDPVPLHARGFDPALYHEDDRTYLLSVQWDHRPARRRFAGIVVQEFDRSARKLVGPAEVVFTGTELGATEGPHLYRKDGWYYLVVAEGGTGYQHAVTVARSRLLTGPYDPDPAGPMLTSARRPDLPLQKAGHGCLVADEDGRWYLAHLTARPVDEAGHCVLGRETAVQAVRWTDGWPRVDGGVPATTVAVPEHYPSTPRPPQSTGFHTTELGPQWQTPRRAPDPSWLSLGERPGVLRLRGDQSPASRHDVSLVARRQTSARAGFTAVVDTRPTSYQQMAGLLHYYDSSLWHWLHVTHDERYGRCLAVLTCDLGTLRDPLAGVVVPWPDEGPVRLRAEVDRAELRLHAATATGPWRRIGPVLDATLVSDEHAARSAVAGGDGTPVEGFTGAFFGVCATDLTGQRLVCDVLDTAITG
ncbi:glycoside hydrolase family 43 protein [Umezawaea sp. NPDC059074]|uniref:glycoside hydrolase family 43 protein n=1 Tax=Umezawaea sp. NPDC059074 TaxID=3346716 RepID=UPI0036BA210F